MTDAYAETRKLDEAVFQYLKMDLEEMIHDKSHKNVAQKRQELSEKLKSRAAADWFRERSEKTDQ